MNTINKVGLKNLYQSFQEQYWERRTSGDKTQYDEEYKWQILPKLNEALSKYSTVDSSSLSEIAGLLMKSSSVSNFAHWIDMDDFRLLLEKPNSWQVIKELWTATPDNVADVIESVNTMAALFTNGRQFSPSTWAYILAARDCGQFAIYREFILKELDEVNHSGGIGRLTRGQKYALLNDSALYIGELMREDKGDTVEHPALNGQDFLWVAFTK